jgi:formate hydrogenlyase subunit 3/multisubunit Na+/H+ antiporter MnhD subunit
MADPIGAGLAVLASTLTLLSLVFSWRVMDSGSNHFQPLMLIFLGAMCGFSLTVDVFNLFVFFELMSTAAFALCGLETKEPAPLQGSFNFAVTNTIAAFLVLTSIGLLYSVTGALNMAQIGLSLGTRHDPLILFAFALITCGFLPAEVGELPDTSEEDRRTRWYQFAPAALCVAIPFLLFVAPEWQSILRNASTVFTSQPAFIHLVYTGNTVPAQLAPWTDALGASAARGFIAILLAVLLACTSVFRLRLKRAFRLGSFLEKGLRPLRLMQSGHPSDYVLWLTIGLASLSAASVLLLRR